MLNEFVTRCLTLVLLFSVVPILLCALVGGVVATLQALTQIQEQSIVFLSKFLMLAAVTAFGFGFFSSAILEFLAQSLNSIALVRG